MLPVFPKFKKLEITDKDDVEKITLKFEPYSDFNFVSIWSWDLKGEMRLSILDGNLVVRFTDYLTGELFYSFLGNEKGNETTNILLHHSCEAELKPKLYLVPQDSISSITPEKFKIIEDVDNFDYIYDLNNIAVYKGSQFANKRNKVKTFLNTYPSARIEIIDLQKKDTQTTILELDKFWLKKKVEGDVNFKVKNELIATQRFFQGKFSELIGVGLFLDDKLIGYSILEAIPSCKYAISHFCKANVTFVGVYDYLVRECAKILIDHKCYKLNYEQDLGLPGLRENKKSFYSEFLKKYIISFPFKQS